MIKAKIGVIGCGNMGQALLRGMLKAGVASGSDLAVWDADAKKLGLVVRGLKVRRAVSNAELAAGCKTLILAVKPQQMEQVLNEIRPHLRPQTLLISIAAGISTKWLEKKAGARVPVVRVMPNTPALIGKGIAAIAGGRFSAEPALKTAEKIFSCVGESVRVPESWMNAVTAVSGSGPAYFFYLIERMIDAAVRLGISREAAGRLVLHTAVGAAELAAFSQEAPAVLRAKVTSKGGTTEAAFRVFEKERLGAILEKGIRAAAQRARKLGG